MGFQKKYRSTEQTHCVFTVRTICNFDVGISDQHNVYNWVDLVKLGFQQKQNFIAKNGWKTLNLMMDIGKVELWTGVVAVSILLWCPPKWKDVVLDISTSISCFPSHCFVGELYRKNGWWKCQNEKSSTLQKGFRAHLRWFLTNGTKSQGADWGMETHLPT